MIYLCARGEELKRIYWTIMSLLEQMTVHDVYDAKSAKHNANSSLYGVCKDSLYLLHSCPIERNRAIIRILFP